MTRVVEEAEPPSNQNGGQDDQLEPNFGPRMLVMRRRSSVHNRRNRFPPKFEANKEDSRGILANQVLNSNKVEDDVQSKSQ